MAEPLQAYAVEPYSYPEARAVVEELGVSEPVAITLVRRGYRTPEEARRFLEADESHPAKGFDSIAEVCERLGSAIGAQRRITVYGDFDVDGVCATTLMVAALRELGAECDWFIPDRLAEGYGLSEESLEGLAARGTSLVLTVDCGITAVKEVGRAAELGLDVIVTDHHRPGPELPECPTLHPAVNGYPFTELCGTAVAWKLCGALRTAAGGDADEAEEATEADLDLVALATVADVVPLIGENRSLVRRGLEVARRARRPGLRALISASGCEPSSLDEADFSFRLAPRINAAGRLYRADAGVELFLSAETSRAEEIAAELGRANQERRAVEREVEAAAEAALRDLPAEDREAAAIVLGGKGWHPGVIGIVASRMVERHWRPVILVSLDEDGGGRGSGRSVPGFDILEGLRSCAGQLRRFGGHKAAAGLELEARNLEGFRREFAAAAGEAIGHEGSPRSHRIDAVVGGAGIGLELAEELDRLGPFGAGNPSPNLLVPSARIRDVREMGGGKHSRFSLHSGAHRALAVAFGRSRIPVGEDEPVDAAVRLEVNHWNGSTEPRLVLREMYKLEDGDTESDRHVCAGPDPAEWWRRFDVELDAEIPQGSGSETDHDAQAGPPPGAGPGQGVGERTPVRHSGSPAAVLAELVSSGGRVLALTADASRRSALAAGAAGLARFGGGAPRIVCGRCRLGALEALRSEALPGLTVCDYAGLEISPRMPAPYDHVVLVDPPPFEHLQRRARAVDAGGGFLHPVWGGSELQLARSVLEEQYGLRWPLISLYKDLRTNEAGSDGEEAGPSDRLLGALRGGGRHPRSPELAARCVRVLLELGLARMERECGVRRLGVVSSDGTELEHSDAFRAYGGRRREGETYLESLKHR